MSKQQHLFKFAFRFEARGHKRVDAWLHVGDELVLGPLHLTEAQSMNMGALMEQAVAAMAEASAPAHSEQTAVRPVVRPRSRRRTA
jgi:hypothetical protein